MTLPLLRLHQDHGAGDDGTDEVPAVTEQPQAARQETASAQPAALVTPDGGRMSIPAQSWTAVAHAFRMARKRGGDLADREGGWVNGLLAGKPPSVSEQREYLRARAWLPPGHEGGIADKAGAVYHRVVGIPGVALGNWVSATCARPFRFAWTLVALTLLLVLTLQAL